VAYSERPGTGQVELVRAVRNGTRFRPARRPPWSAPSTERTPMSLMTIDELSRRTGMSLRALRRYEAMGLIYTAARSPRNSGLFDETALRCVHVIRSLRALGLSLGEIRQLAGIYLAHPDQPIGSALAERLSAVRARLDRRAAKLRELRRRLDEFEAATGRTSLAWPGPTAGPSTGPLGQSLTARPQRASRPKSTT
jgi:MerR family transcriptional regulator, copper efflux regulator